LGEETLELIGQLRQIEVMAGEREIGVEDCVTRVLEERANPFRVKGGEELKSQGTNLPSDGVVTEGKRTPMGDGLDDRIPKSLPERGQYNDVSGAIGVID
jgi:hypothetical protein